MQTAEVLRGFLAALGVPPDQRLVQLDELSAAYRSVLAYKQVLVVLDNAHDSEQVRALLPGGPDCVTVVTSRSRLLDLVAIEGARTVSLDLLEAADAYRLLAGVLGEERLAAERAAANELIDACARLPLALCVAAARIASRPNLPLSVFAGELRHVRGRLDMLTLARDTANVRAVLSWSYGHLSEPAARMFRLLGHGFGPDISLPAAASLAGLAVGPARRLLDELADGNLLTETVPGRFALHDLLRIYAGEQARDTDDEADIRRAVHRLLDHYLYSAFAAGTFWCARLERRLASVDPANLEPGAIVEHFTDDAQVMAWYTADHHVLLAAVAAAAEQGFDEHAGQLPLCLTFYLDSRGHWSDILAVQRVSLAAADRSGDLGAQARAHQILGETQISLGSLEEANRHLDAAHALCVRLDDQAGLADLELSRGWLFRQRGEDAKALECYLTAQKLFAEAGDPLSQAHALCSVGWTRAYLGEYEQALTCCESALTSYRELSDQDSQAGASYILGHIHRKTGEYEKAIAYYRSAVELYNDTARPLDLAEVLCDLGDVHDEAWDSRAAVLVWQKALAILDELKRPQAEALREKIAGRR